jgi:hypothetical protein
MSHPILGWVFLGRREYVKDEAKSESSQARSSASEVIPSNGLRNRKHTKAKGSSTGNAADDHNTGQVSEAVGDHLEAMEPSRVVGHYQSSGTSDSGWMAKICGSCHMHNGEYTNLFCFEKNITITESPREITGAMNFT